MSQEIRLDLQIKPANLIWEKQNSNVESLHLEFLLSNIKSATSSVVIMLLHELPEDILQIIIDLLDGEASQIRDVALVCRVLNKVAGPRVPEVLHLSSKNFDLFQRSLTEHSAYRLGVRFIELCEWDSAFTMQEFLGGFPNLQRLELHFTYIESIVLSVDLQLLDILQIVLTACNIKSARELSKLLCLPQIRSLELEEGESLEDFQLPPPTNFRSGLQHLNTAAYDWTYPMFEHTLQVCQNLRILECTVPVDTPVQRSPPFTFIQHLSPLRVSRGLNSVAKTLTKLNLYNDGNKFWPSPGHDGTRLDLSDFLCLKNLSVSAELFFSPLSLGIARDGFYKLLPRSVENIWLRFCWDIGIFYSTFDQHIDTDRRQRLLEERLEPDSYQWILEIAENSPTCLQSLVDVTLTECPAQGNCRVFLSEKWALPLAVKQAFDQVSVDLDVSVRAPRR